MSNKKQNDEDSSSSDSESDNEESQPQIGEQDFPTLSLVDDEKTILHIPKYEDTPNTYNDEEPGECDDVNKVAQSAVAAAREKSAKKPPDIDPEKQKRGPKRKKKRLLYICLTNCKYDSVRRAAKRFGFKEVGEEENWNLFWTDFSVSLERVMDMKRYQKINHFPGMSELCRKDLLARNLNRMVKLYPKEYNFFPRSWCLPADFGDFLAYTRQKKNKTYILKPESGCQGKGIWLTRSPKEIKPNEHMLCQQYVSKPFLVDGFKFDLRVYVVITACDPLRIFVFEEGLGRFATCKYIAPSSANVSNVFMHLTNYAINKNSTDFNRDDEAGSKRRITTINRWLAENGYDVDKAWRDVDDVIIKTLISAHTVLKHNYRTCFPNHVRGSACFEVLGFDIVFDRKLRPIVLEVNHSPSFTTDAPIDREIKDILLYDTLNLINFGATDRRRCIEEDRKKVKERLLAKQDKKELKEDQDRAIQKWLEEQTVYEDTHLGNFRRIYPNEGSEKYDKFFHSSGSLYQETAAFKARSECARQQREEIRRKQKVDGALRKKKDGTGSGLLQLRPESPPTGSASRSTWKRTGNSSATIDQGSTSDDDDDSSSAAGETVVSKPVRETVRRKKFSAAAKSHAQPLKQDPQPLKPVTTQPTEILDVDEARRVSLLTQRDSLVRNLGIIEVVHRLIKSVQTADSTTLSAAPPSASNRPGAAVSTGLAGGDHQPNLPAVAVETSMTSAHQYLSAMNSRPSQVLPAASVDPSQRGSRQQQQQTAVMSTTSTSYRRGLPSQGRSNVDTNQWRQSMSQNVVGSQHSLLNEQHSTVGNQRARYSNRRNLLGSSDSNAQISNDPVRGPGLMRHFASSTSPSAQHEAMMNGSSASAAAIGQSAYQPAQPPPPAQNLFPQINKSPSIPQNNSTSYYGLSVVSAPVPFSQRAATGSTAAVADQSPSGGLGGGVVGLRMDSGGGFRGHQRPLNFKGGSRDSSGI